MSSIAVCTILPHSNEALQLRWNVGLVVEYKDLVFVEITSIQQSTLTVIRITSVGIGEKAGLGPATDNPQSIALEQYGIVVDERVSYEITFLVKQIDVGSTISFGAFAYDHNGTQQDLRNIENDLSSNFFFEQEIVNQTGRYYLVRGIVFAKTTIARVDGEGVELEFLKGKGTSHHLKFRDNVCKLVPVVVVENPTAADSDVYLYDFKIRPLQTPHSLGFVNSPNFIQIWLQNNNPSYTIKKIEDEIRRFLIPYNSSLYLLNLDAFERRIELDDFDFIVIRYIYEAVAGINLDTRTAIVDVDPSVDGDDVGFGRGYQVGTFPNFYLQHAGDNTSSTGGQEVVLVNVKTITQMWPTVNPINIRLRAFWGDVRLNGLITIEFETYRGGAMIQVGDNFINDGGTQIDKAQIQRVVNSQGGGVSNDGEDMGIISYFPVFKKAILN